VIGDKGSAAATLKLVRLLQLASPTLPIGAYSYSQGIESMVAEGAIHDGASAQRWIGEVLECIFAPGEAAVLWHMLLVAQKNDWQGLREWNNWFLASRETAELRAETEQMGGSLAGLARDLGILDVQLLAVSRDLGRTSLPAAYALVAIGFGLPADATLTAYAWAWLENQVMAAIKSIPVGQVAGQRLLLALGERIPAMVARAQMTDAVDVATFAPGLAIACARHETQYSRLFRS